jgi:hypothetical protein
MIHTIKNALPPQSGSYDQSTLVLGLDADGNYHLATYCYSKDSWISITTGSDDFEEEIEIISFPIIIAWAPLPTL